MNFSFKQASIISLVIILALIAPLFLLPIERILPYPYVIEELTKLSLVLLIIRLPKNYIQSLTAVLTGFLFALSESLFYLGSTFGIDQPSLFPQKLVFTALIHVLTIALFWLSLKINKKLLIFTLPLAMLAHYFFNRGI